MKLIQRHSSGDQVAVTTILLPPLRPRLLKLVVVHPTNSCINMERGFECSVLQLPVEVQFKLRTGADLVDSALRLLLHFDIGSRFGESVFWRRDQASAFCKKNLHCFRVRLG